MTEKTNIEAIADAKKLINDLSNQISECLASKAKKQKMWVLLGEISYALGHSHGKIDRYEEILSKNKIEL